MLWVRVPHTSVLWSGWRQCAVTVGDGGRLRNPREPTIDLCRPDLVDRFFAELCDDLPDPDLDTPKVAMMLLAEYEDVVAKRLEANRSVPHVFRHLDASANLVLALDEELACCLVCANLLTLQDTINPVANPPATRCRC